MEYSKADYIKYRLKRADEETLAAQTLVAEQLWNSALNRLYYAAFYAVNALLLSKDISVKTHHGLKRMFDLHFVKTGIVSKESGIVFTTLYTMRGEGDYSDFMEFEKETVVPLMQEVIDFIEEIKSKIKIS
jgi:uncharacterized protein (UPF0332 family)